MQTFIVIEKDLNISADEFLNEWNGNGSHSNLPFLTKAELPKTFSGELVEFIASAGPVLTAFGAIAIDVIWDKIQQLTKKKPTNTKKIVIEQMETDNMKWFKLSIEETSA